MGMASGVRVGVPEALMRAVALAVLVTLPAAVARAQPAERPATYVIVHGAWGGSWDWRQVEALLRARGHHVRRIALTGLGERVHLAMPEINLTTHITDVLNAVVWDELREVVLVGHSYGGMVITGAADRMPARVRRLVYVDAMLPQNGESVMDITSPEMVAMVKKNTRDGFIEPPWVKAREPLPHDVAQPLKTFTEKIVLASEAARGLPATYILTVAPGQTEDDFDRFAERARKRGWPVVRMAADHVPERSAPEALVELLRAIP
jgi:pimeloyl-ACP methyl ester carboxylesterase